MAIGATTAAVPVFTKFDNIAFSSGTGSQLLSIKSANLYLIVQRLHVRQEPRGHDHQQRAAGGQRHRRRGRDAGAVRRLDLRQQHDLRCDQERRRQAQRRWAPRSRTASGTTRAPTARSSSSSARSPDDTAGNIIGFPTAAFDWNTFTYYSTYVAFHNASGGTSDVIYVRDELGNPLYSWTVPTVRRDDHRHAAVDDRQLEALRVRGHQRGQGLPARRQRHHWKQRVGDADAGHGAGLDHEPVQLRVHDQHAAGDGRQQRLLGKHHQRQELLDRRHRERDATPRRSPSPRW